MGTYGKCSVLATKAVGTQGKGSDLATKAVGTQGKCSVLATKAVRTQDKGSVLPEGLVPGRRQLAWFQPKWRQCDGIEKGYSTRLEAVP